MPQGKQDPSVMVAASTAPSATNEIIEVLSTIPSPHAPDPWRIIEYEISMFQALACVQVHPAVPQFVKNGLAESFLLHVRNLCEIFLPPDEKKKDDLRPSDLFPD
jgi:hypothetical protein